MHAVIIEDLEEYLSGILPPPALDRFQAHLDTCVGCRGEVERMQQASSLLASLKIDEPVEPGPGFAAQVMQAVAAGPAPSYWSIFGDFAFGRQVAFASLLTLAVLGTVLVSREESYEPAPPTPEAVMAADTGSPNADQMLVTLANYEP
jgi:anti-sigma factor RsiW